VLSAARLRWLIPVALVGIISTLRQVLLTVNEGREHR
jgi:hypothetical protein